MSQPDLNQTEQKKSTVIVCIAFPAITVTVRRECLDRVGMYADSVVYGDRELWIRLLNFYKIGFVDEPLAKYRIHGSNTSIGTEPSKHFALVRQMYQYLKDNIQKPIYFKLRETKYQKAISEQLALLPKREAQMYFDRYFQATARNDWGLAKLEIIRAFKLSPSTVCRPRRIAAVIKHAFVAKNT